MKSKIEITSTYGFDRNWTLVLTTPKITRRFYLGQDVKFCTRILGIHPKDIIRSIGTPNISEKEGNKSLAIFIVQKLGLTPSNIDELDDWSLCSE